MYRQQSLSRISSRSLSKIKTKVELAFSKPPQLLKNKKQPSFRPMRSKSTNSLPKSKIQATQNHIPFAVALKSGLLSTEKKPSISSSPLNQPKIKMINQETLISSKLEQSSRKGQCDIFCSKSTKNESIVGFSWYHQGGKELISVRRQNEGKFLRYFAVQQTQDKKVIKRVLAALEEDTLYTGSKEYMLIQSDKKGLLSKEQTSKVSVRGNDFVLLTQRSLMDFCNINRVVSDIYSLIKDGLSNLDTIAKIMGRKLQQLRQKNSKRQSMEIFLLIVLVQTMQNKDIRDKVHGELAEGPL